VQTFDELISLAEKGDCHQVDMFTNDFINSEALSDEGDSIYKLTSLGKPSLLVCFGKVADNDGK
jgi:pantothenate kinase